ncbi:30S ribosomal protein S7 [Candidatus Woesearchaeota archaeon]|nr:MAG: 30S ribosomal protein S7 [Candidatus Woesearchaeota archaeon]
MEIKAFDRWSTEGIVVEDLGLQRYISLEPRLLPKTGARYAQNKFYKSKIFIVERLINKLMNPGHRGKKHKRTSGSCTGKSNTTYKLVYDALDIIEKKTKLNPLAVFVRALENAAPREATVTIEYGGARYPKAVEVSPQRRIDIALRMMIQGTHAKAFNKKKGAVQALADEILNAYQISQASDAIAKKVELERQADASR